MAFMKKEELLKEASRLGIDISTMKYQDQVAAVAAAQREESYAINGVEPSNEKPVEDKRESIRKRNLEYGRTMVEEMRNERIRIAPAIRPEAANVLFKYEEVLENKKDVEEVSYDLDSLKNPNSSVSNDGTFRIIGEQNEKVVATSSFPKENASIDYYPGRDWFPVVTDPTTGMSGYQYQKYVKPYLIKSGWFEDYANYFDSRKYPNNNFYICGHSCVRKELVDWIFQDINKKVKNNEQNRYQ